MDKTSIYIFVVFMVLVLMFSIISNILVIVSVVKFGKLRKTTNMLISNLAVSDILLAGIFIPMKLHDLWHTDNYHEGIVLCKFINFIPVLLITGACYTLVCISFERRRAIITSHKPQITFAQVRKCILIIWLFSCVIAFPSLLEYSTNTLHEGNNTTESHILCSNLNMPKTFILVNGCFVLVLSFLVPLVLVFWNYIHLARFINKRGRQVCTNGHGVNTVSGEVENRPVVSHLHKNRLKLIKMMIIIATLYAVCWVPFFVLYIYMKVTGKDASKDVGSSVGLLTVAMATFSTAYNVILYVIFNQNFRQAFKHILKCTWKPLIITYTNSPSR